MNQTYFLKPVVFIAVITLLSLPAWACRFNVRDVGFVDFGQTPYQLYIAYNKLTSQEHKDALEQIGFAALLESNVQFEMVDVETNADHQVKQYIKDLQIEEFPAAMLISPKGKLLSLPISLDQPSYRDAIWEVMESVVTNDLRETILDQAIERYGLVLLIKGQDEALNQSALTASKEAVSEIELRMDSLPKEIKQPPALMELTYEEAMNETVLLWALGISKNELNKPHAAVLYGRGRCLGEILSGDAITKSTVGEILSVIGLSCECGLDREWMMGRQLPLRWGTERQELVIKNLGFDAESPLVKTEISQIMAIGQRNAAEAAGSGTSREISLNPIMGYSEMVVEAAPVEPPDAPRVVEESDSDEDSSVIAVNDSSPNTEAAIQSPKSNMINSSAAQQPIETQTSAHLGIGFYILLIAALASLITGVSIIIWARSKNV